MRCKVLMEWQSAGKVFAWCWHGVGKCWQDVHKVLAWCWQVLTSCWQVLARCSECDGKVLAACQQCTCRLKIPLRGYISQSSTSLPSKRQPFTDHCQHSAASTSPAAYGQQPASCHEVWTERKLPTSPSSLVSHFNAVAASVRPQ